MELHKRMVAPSKKRLGEILVEAGLIDEFQVRTGLTEQKRWGGKLGEHLIRLGYVSEDAILDVLRNQLKIPSVNLKKVEIPKEIIQMISEDRIRKNKTLPVGIKNIGGKDHLIVAMSDPSNLGVLDDLQFATKMKILPALAGIITLDRAIRFYLDNQGDLFSDETGEDPFSPVTIRDRVDITDGSRTVTGASLGGEAKLPPPKPEEPPPFNPATEASIPLSPEEIDITQIRAELSALRNLLLEKKIVDRKTFIDKVIQEKEQLKK